MRVLIALEAEKEGVSTPVSTVNRPHVQAISGSCCVHLSKGLKERSYTGFIKRFTPLFAYKKPLKSLLES